ncbi:coiled-coil domain-containing protein 185 [Choloepus didactylus]|uniref:coiled-coil domain-containing protein 185 n=1 Tax=Choloepus didactylus TaxID=27675 RepID=UPI00189CAD70|nr:coiled-coil domain-containing protein 185 [Choloepus didactylus]
MAGLGHFSPRPYRDLWDPPALARERVSSARLAEPGTWVEPALSAWARAPVDESETEAPWQALQPRCSSTRRPRRPLYADAPQESRSLTDVARRLPNRARKLRSRSRRLEDAWGEAETKQQGGVGNNLAWQSQTQLQLQQPQPCQDFPPARRDSPPPNSGETYTPLSGTFGKEKVQSGEQWAVPVCRGLDHWSLSSLPTEKSSVPSKEVRTQSTSVYTQNRNSKELTGSVPSHCSLSLGSSQEIQSQQTQILKNKLAEAVISSRDQKIVDLVLVRLKKAQRMRELQQQAAVAWEELKRSDQKVQMTLERERWLLLQQGQERWQQEKEQHKALLSWEQHSRQASRVKNMVQKESQWKTQLDDEENQLRENLERARTQVKHQNQCQMQQLREQEKVLQGLREQNILQLQKRLEQACYKTHQHTMEDRKKAQETNLTSLVNHQARKVLMECQAKAEELLRKLSLEQSFQQTHETHRCLLKEHHRELRDKARKKKYFQQVKWHAGESEEQRKVHKRMLMELADQKIQQARSNVHKNLRDKVQHIRDLNILQEKNHHILRLKAEKEEKCHIEGIKEAIKKKEQRMDQISREKEATLEDFRKISRASLQVRDKMRPLHNSSLRSEALDAQHCASQQRGSY